MEKAAAERQAEQRKQQIKRDVMQMNADAIAAQLQEFENRLHAQDIRLAAIQGRLQQLEQQVTTVLQHAMTAGAGRGPTA